MNLANHLAHFLTHHQLNNATIVLGLSGGVDSVVLLDLLAKSTLGLDQIKVIHVNHGLSDEALKWQHFCEELCHSYRIEFYCEKVDITDLSLGIEGAARQARYAALSKYMSDDSVLLTAQHENDQAETLLLALKRGSGVLGLAAMQPVSQLPLGRQARPLLGVSQLIINQYATLHGLEWVEDDSNVDIRFDRNFLRHNIIKTLNDRWPHFSQSAARSAQLCQEHMMLADEIAHIDLANCRVTDKQISLAHLSTLTDVRINNVLRYWLRQNSVALPSQKQFAQLVNQLFCAKADANISVELGHHRIKRYLANAYITSSDDSELERILVDDNFSSIVLLHGLGEITFNACDAKIRVKAPEAGQRVTIEFGLSGSTKGWPIERDKRRSLKKLWQEYEVAPWQRSQVPCLCYDGVLIAALGYWIEKEYGVIDDNDSQLLIDWYK